MNFLILAAKRRLDCEVAPIEVATPIWIEATN
jgi:hypothetical protein